MSSIEDLAAALSSPRRPRIQLDSSSVLQTMRRVDSAVEFLVWRVHTTGTAVNAGTIELPQAGILLLTGHGVVFHDTKFTGGVVMCAGEAFSGTFRECHFQATTLYAVHGAAVTLRGCDIRGSHPGLVASGSATHATLLSCTASGCAATVAVDRGAAVTAEDCNIRHTDAGVTADGAGSHAALFNCTLAQGFSKTHGARGVVASDGARILVHACDVSQCMHAMHSVCRTCVIETHGLCTRDVISAFRLCARQWLHARECSLHACANQGNTPSCVLGLGDQPKGGGGSKQALQKCPQVQISQCELLAMDVNTMGVDAQWGGNASAHLCVISNSAHAGTCMMVKNGAAVTLSHCESVDSRVFAVAEGKGSKLAIYGGRFQSQTVCHAEARAKVVAVGCAFDGPKVLRDGWGHVISLDSRAVLRLLRCQIQNGAAGVHATKSTCYATDTVISCMQPRRVDGPAGNDYRGPGVGYACHAGLLHVKGGSVTLCSTGVSCDCTNTWVKGVCASLTNLVVADCDMGVSIVSFSEEDGGRRKYEVEVSGCEFRGLNREVPFGTRYEMIRSDRGIVIDSQQGLNVDGDGVARVSDCLFDSLKVGACCAFSAGVSVARCRFIRALEGTRWVVPCPPGEVTLSDCCFTGNEHLECVGIEAQSSSVCVVRHCEFKCLCDTGVSVHGRATVRVLAGTTFEKCGSAVYTYSHATAHLADCQISGGDMDMGLFVEGPGVALTAERVRMHVGQYAVHAQCEEGGARSRLTLTDCQVKGGLVGVYLWMEGVHALLSNCMIEGCQETGVLLRGTASCEIESSEIRYCKEIGVSVAQPSDDDGNACHACGKQGKIGLKRAVDAVLRRDRGDVVHAARCVHDGGVAKCTLRKVKMVKCREYGVLVGWRGCLDAQDVRIYASEAAFWVMHVGEMSSRLVRCRGFDCGDAGVAERLARENVLNDQDGSLSVMDDVLAYEAAF